MKTTAVLWFCLFCFGINLQQGFGQCTGQFYYRDSDGDRYGTSIIDDSNLTLAKYTWIEGGSPQNGYIIEGNVAYGCSQPSGFALDKIDLDDNNACITYKAPQHFYLDADGDGFGDPAISVYCSSPPANYVSNTTDNCDNNPATLVELTWYQDADGDGMGGSWGLW